MEGVKDVRVKVKMIIYKNVVYKKFFFCMYKFFWVALYVA